MSSFNVPALCVSLAMLLQHTRALLLQRRLLEYLTQLLEHETQPLWLDMAEKTELSNLCI